MFLFLCELEILTKWREKSVSATRQRKVFRWWRKFFFLFLFSITAERLPMRCARWISNERESIKDEGKWWQDESFFFFLFLALNFSLPFTASRNEKAFGERPRALRRSQGDEYLIKPESSLFSAARKITASSCAPTSNIEALTVHRFQRETSSRSTLSCYSIKCFNKLQVSGIRQIDRAHLRLIWNDLCRLDWI